LKMMHLKLSGHLPDVKGSVMGSCTERNVPEASRTERVFLGT
jgi:hypothetical protein